MSCPYNNYLRRFIRFIIMSGIDSLLVLCTSERLYCRFPVLSASFNSPLIELTLLKVYTSNSSKMLVKIMLVDTHFRLFILFNFARDSSFYVEQLGSIFRCRIYTDSFSTFSTIFLKRFQEYYSVLFITDSNFCVCNSSNLYVNTT